MPRYLQFNSLAVWMTLACLSMRVINAADILEYGTRLHPPSHVTSAQKYRNCLTCPNKTSNIRTEVQNIQGKLNEPITIKQESTAANSMVKELNAKIKNFFTVKPLIKSQTNSNPDSPKDNSKREATFFFTQVEPHRFEYRAMFQHHGHIPGNVFQPFVHDFEGFGKEFPPLPKFPTFPEFPDFFPEHKDPFPNIHEYSFPTLPPAVKRNWQPSIAPSPPQRPKIEEKFEGPLKDYDVVLGHKRYPKIFRFNEERVNIEEFDRQKKLRFYSLGKEDQNELSEPEHVKRDQLLILHGGIFTVQEPPLFNKHRFIKKRRKPGGFGLHQSGI
ncbi:uncharacterized protein NPIL_179621 [Nephila pilipes]|uniref:Spider venom protein n=1 Tax=Nephila pilipes TaxID=299642 RepID=A0A8X6MYI6_NEPPI|nr:uncharacterized protein NPIL_179621 [Nephila pilipes]